ncbi:MAG: DUF2723 domain-containing protein [Anaerolineales bacterium]|nr:DUF2723 domain-containing protein [Anaerolineales bacterium]
MTPLQRLRQPRAPLLATLLALLIYRLTLAPDLTWAHHGGDGGDLITAAVTLGVPHPTGYPLYVLLGQLISHFPAGNIPFRFNLFSALCLALAAGLVAATTRARPGIQLAAGLTFALLPLVWSQAVISEVYGLNLLLVAALLWVLRRPMPPPAARPGLAAGLLWGLSLTTHLTSLLLLPLILWSWTRPPRPVLRYFLAGLLLGLTLLCLPPLLAAGSSPVVWGDLSHPAGWWWLVSGQLYRYNVLALPPADWLPRLAQWSRAALLGYAWFILPLLWLGRRTLLAPGRGNPTWPITLTATLYTLYAFGYHTNDAAVFLLPALLLLSILLADGLRPLGPAALLLPIALLMLNFDGQNLSRDQIVRPLAGSVLRAAPANAILMAPGDQTIFTLWYFQHVEGQRPDLILVDSNLFAFDWYRQRLGQQYPELHHLAEDDLPGFRAQNGTQPICDVALTAPQPLICPAGVIPPPS